MNSMVRTARLDREFYIYAYAFIRGMLDAVDDDGACDIACARWV
jgi:hypothetical protein